MSTDLQLASGTGIRRYAFRAGEQRTFSIFSTTFRSFRTTLHFNESAVAFAVQRTLDNKEE
jgi:hypothetical protein